MRHKTKTMLNSYQHFNTIMKKDIGIHEQRSCPQWKSFIRYKIHFATTLFEFIMEYT